ncbi:MAG: alpha/beta fold hydrolase [Proteobacteria bacterium]|nr:alpha/beta fold hydrolase [Pseudomonadota bacterium]
MRSIINDMIKLWSEAVVTGKPDWITPNTRETDNNAYALLNFTNTEKRKQIPVLILPPQAGHHSCIVDFGSPEQSLVSTCIHNTKSPVYAIEWKNSIRKDESIDDLVRYVDECVEKIGGKAVLTGLCQGGWLAAVYASLYPEKVKAMLLGAAPIDFTAGGGKLQDMVQNIPLSQYKMFVLQGGGILPGKTLLAGWKLTNAYDRYIGDYLAMFNNIVDDERIKKTRQFRTWYEYTQDISGKWYIQAVKKLFKGNYLIKKKLAVMGEIIDLEKINCPVALIAGEKDDITLKPQMFNMVDHISTEKEKIIKITIPESGHIGVFMRTKSQPYWIEALNFIFDSLNDGNRKYKNAA